MGYVANVALLVLVALVGFPALAQEMQQLIPFQAKLVQPDGQGGEVVVDDSVEVTFKIYEEADGGYPLWEEPHSNVTVVDGHINVLLGATTEFKDGSGNEIDFSDPKFLGITVGDGGQEMRPRHELVPSFFSWGSRRATNADHADDSLMLGGILADDYLPKAEWLSLSNDLLLTIGALGERVDDLEDAGDAWPAESWAGACNGRVVTSSTDPNFVQLEPVNASVLVIEIGDQLHKRNTPVSFDWSGLRDGETEQVSTFYYLYVEPHDINGLVGFMSATPPVLGARNHPDHSASRYVGEVYNDDAGNLAHLEHDPLSGEFRLARMPWTQVELTVPPTSTTYQEDSGALSSKLPVTASAALVQVSVTANDVALYIAHESRVGDSVPLNCDSSGDLCETVAAAGARIETFTTGSLVQTSNEIFWLPVNGTAPRFAYATVGTGDASIECIGVSAIGWRSLR